MAIFCSPILYYVVFAHFFTTILAIVVCANRGVTSNSLLIFNIALPPLGLLLSIFLPKRQKVRTYPLWVSVVPVIEVAYIYMAFAICQ